MTTEDTKLDLEALDRALSIKTALVNIMVMLSQRDQYKRECESLRERLKEAYALLADARRRLHMLDGEKSPAYIVGATNAQGAAELVRKWRDEPEPVPADYPTERTTL